MRAVMVIDVWNRTGWWNCYHAEVIVPIPMLARPDLPCEHKRLHCGIPGVHVWCGDCYETLFVVRTR